MQKYPSFIRTYAPMVVGLLVTLLGNAGIVLPAGAAEGLAELVGCLAGMVYYAVVRWLEAKWPWLGFLLGWDQAPIYVDPEPVFTEADFYPGFEDEPLE
jgi:hypothetical protein